MKITRNCVALAAVFGAFAGAVAQQSPVDAPPPAAAAPPSPKAKPALSAQSEAGEPRADTSAPTPPPAPATPPPPKGRTPVVAGQKNSNATDKLNLGTATVTGEHEQPKVMYIVPWKSSSMGDLAGKPMNSLVDEILAPVDRDVFKREVIYYQAVQSDASQNGASAKPSPQGEK